MTCLRSVPPFWWRVTLFPHRHLAAEFVGNIQQESHLMPRALHVGRFDGHERDDALAVSRDVITPKTARGAAEPFIGPHPRG